MLSKKGLNLSEQHPALSWTIDSYFDSSESQQAAVLSQVTAVTSKRVARQLVKRASANGEFGKPADPLAQIKVAAN